MEKSDLPPPYEPQAPPNSAGTAPPPQAPYPPSYQQQAGYQQPAYPPTSQPGYPPTSQPGYPPTSQPAYPPTSQPGYAPPHGYAPPQKHDYPPHSGYAPHPGYAPAAVQQQSSNTTVIVTGQPTAAPVTQQIVHEVPSNYMALSWLVCLFCCWPIGIAAIMASSRVDSAVAVGNYAYAQQQSRRAKNLAISAIFCGILIYILLVVRFTVLASTYSSNYN